MIPVLLLGAACDCPKGQTRCESDVPGGAASCTDLSTDDFHCGSCSGRCRLGEEICSAGKCIACKVPSCGPNETFDRASCSCSCAFSRCGLDGGGGCCLSLSCCGGKCCESGACCGSSCCDSSRLCCGGQCCSTASADGRCCLPTGVGTLGCPDVLGQCGTAQCLGQVDCGPIDPGWCCWLGQACLGEHLCMNANGPGFDRSPKALEAARAEARKLKQTGFAGDAGAGR